MSVDSDINVPRVGQSREEPAGRGLALVDSSYNRQGNRNSLPLTDREVEMGFHEQHRGWSPPNLAVWYEHEATVQQTV